MNTQILIAALRNEPKKTRLIAKLHRDALAAAREEVNKSLAAAVSEADKILATAILDEIEIAIGLAEIEHVLNDEKDLAGIVMRRRLQTTATPALPKGMRNG